MLKPFSVIAELLSTPDSSVESNWQNLIERLQVRFKKELSLEGVLFLIGIQENKLGFQRNLSKEEKQSLINDGTYFAFEHVDLYEKNTDGNWQPIANIPKLTLPQQEKVLKLSILSYFERREFN